MPLDLWNRPSSQTYRIHTPEIYATLRAQPPGGVAEYPLRPIVRIGHYMDLYYQQAHGRPLLNGWYGGPDERRALSLADLSDPKTAPGLATLGVRYVLVTPPIPGVPPPGEPGRGFDFVARDAYASLYRVTARPKPLVYEREGFLGAEGEPGQRFQWVGGSQVELEIIARCDPCSGALAFGAESFARPRRLVVTTPDGRTVYRGRIGVDATTVVVPLQFRRRVVLKLDIDPGPQSIQETTGNPDPRVVSLLVRNPRFFGFG